MKMQTKWDLSVLYRSPSDPKIIRDVKRIESAYKSFAETYTKDKSYLSDAKKLLQALDSYEELILLPSPTFYLFLFRDIDSGNKEAEAQENKISHILTKSANEIVFFTLSLGKLSKEKQNSFLGNPTLSKYRYFLQNIFENSTHDLSESEEKIVSLLVQPSYSMWVDGQEKLLSAQMVKFAGKDMPISEAMNKVKDLPVKNRRELWGKIREALKHISPFAESEINAIVTRKKISDELRGYKKPYSATILGYQNKEDEIENLVASVTRAFPISHKFFNLKKKMLDLPYLAYEDRNAPVGKNSKKIDFKETVNIVHSAFAKADKKYADILDKFLQKGQVDVFPKKGKKGGAYCASMENTPTFVMLNHSDNLDSVSTLGHEMGHAIHAELSKAQPPIYRGHTISVAEVASTLFENFVFDEIFEKLSEKEKIVALHNKIEDDIQTIFRQIAVFNFENELHETIRDRGGMSKEDIAGLMNKHMKSYLGSAFKLQPDDGYFFVAWSHIRRFFYVYSYAYGQIVSRALYAKYKQNKNYLKKIEEFLKAGGSKSPEAIFRDIGIDTSDPKFFEAGLKNIETDIERLEKMLKNAKKS